MLPEHWNEITHFNPTENWGDPKKMRFFLIQMLDELRNFIGKRIHINCGFTTSGHSSNSQHYLGKAVDCYAYDMHVMDFYFAAERFSFGGIGIYFDWNVPGLHLDVRNFGTYESAARWMRVDGRYMGITWDLLKRHG